MSAGKLISCDRTTLVAIFLGIDGGGSKTSCLIGDEMSVLGTGTAAGSNMVRVGEAQARESLASAIRQACTVASVKPSEITRVCVGLAGAARAEVSQPVRAMISEIISGEGILRSVNPDEIIVVGDMVIALKAAFGDGPGVIVIAGTGSIAYGRNREGQIARAGGWGFAISDEGSGHWIGRTAIAACLRAWDENHTEHAPMLDGLMKSWNIDSREKLVLAANATPPPDFAALFPSVAGVGGFRRSGRARCFGPSWNRSSESCRHRHSAVVSELGSVPVAMSGGVFGSSALVRQVFYNSSSCRVSRRGPQSGSD